MSSGKPQNPQSWNRYSYCLNHPLVLVDPDGLIWGTYTKGDTIYYQWYEDQNALEAAGATVVTNFVVNMLDGTWVALNPNANQHSNRESSEWGARKDLWGYTGLAPSWQDWVPVWGQTRQFFFNYTVGNYGHAVANFSFASAEGGSMGAGFLNGLGRQAATETAEEGILRFSQTTASPLFSEEGNFAGKTIGQLANDLRSGAVAPKDVPVGVVNGADGIRLIVNTRSSLALTRAGIAQRSWSIIDLSANQTVRANIEQRLIRNGLTNQGTEVLRITGMGKGASSLF